MKDLLNIFENQIMVFGLTKKKNVSKLEKLPQKVIPKQLTLDYDPSDTGHIKNLGKKGKGSDLMVPLPTQKDMQTNVSFREG